MYRKRIILILTSRDESDGISQKIAEAIRKIGTHNVVVISDDKYGSATKLSALDKLMDSGSEYQYLLEKKDKGVIRDMFKLKSLSKRVNRINNLIKRFHPEYILCVTPYAHHCAVEAKRRARFNTQIIYMLQSFTLPKRVHDDATNVFIVENADVKADLVRQGIKSKDVMVMGFPYEAVPKTREEIILKKQEAGLPKVKTVYVNVQEKKQLENVFSLLLDQGEIANLAVYVKDERMLQTLSSMAVKAPETKVLFLQNGEQADDCLPVCDVAITQYDPATLYKCFKLGVPSIVAKSGEHEQADISYLASHELCLVAKNDLDIVGLLYRLLQSDVGEKIASNGKKWVEMSSLENIANFLTAYIAV